MQTETSVGESQAHADEGREQCFVVGQPCQSGEESEAEIKSVNQNVDGEADHVSN